MEKCQNSEGSAENMNINQNSEDDYMKHSCNICGKQILTKKKLKQHQDAVHKNEGIKCTECDHRLKSKSILNQHIRAVHEGVMYPCRQCDRKAPSKGSLAQHKRTLYDGVKYPSRRCDHRAIGFYEIVTNLKEGIVTISQMSLCVF